VKRSAKSALAGVGKRSAVLILAYGNPLRGDDGAAWRAANVLHGKFPESQVETRCLHQLAPELAEILSRFACVIFVDAASQQAGKAGEIRVEMIGTISGNEAGAVGHSLSPGALLTLAANVYGARPRAFSVTVTGQNFGHGDRLSPVVAAAVPDLIGRVEWLVQSALSGDSLPPDGAP
jgi:hydrogenase maturation protease